jgi:hypothetical protein
MPTKRQRRTRGSAVPDDIYSVFEIGAGWNTYSQTWLCKTWREWGGRIIDRYRRENTEDRKCWGQMMAELEGWGHAD